MYIIFFVKFPSLEICSHISKTVWICDNWRSNLTKRTLIYNAKFIYYNYCERSLGQSPEINC